VQYISNEPTIAKRYVVDVIQGVYPIELLHSIGSGQSNCTLQYMSDIMPLQPIAAPDISCCAQHLQGSPHNVQVRPSGPCAALSAISLMASLWTAGVVGSIEISTKDMYGNFISSWDNRWHVFMTSAIPLTVKEFSREKIYGGKNFARNAFHLYFDIISGTNNWRFTATATIASRYKVQAILLGATAGLSATAYSTLGGSSLSNSFVASHNDVRKGLQLLSSSQIYAVYAGYFVAARSGTYTFQILKRTSLNETIRLTVGGVTGVDMMMNETNCTSNSMGYCDITATCLLESPGNMYAVGVEYTRNDFSALEGNFSLNFQFQNSPYFEMMPHVFPILGTKVDAIEVLVAPSMVNAASSMASGNCLTIATAGSVCQFSIATRDEFGSLSFISSNVSILCSSFIDANYVSLNAANYDGSNLRASYVPSVAGYHILSVLFKNSILQWTLLVTPASLAVAEQSVVKGSALSLATAGTSSKFTVFALDKYMNMLERTDNIAIIVENEAKSEYHALTLDSNRAVNTMVFKDMTAEYRVTTAGHYRITVAALDKGLSMTISLESAGGDPNASSAYFTTSDDINLQSYHTLRPNFQKTNVSKIYFSGFLSATTSGIFTFKVLTSSTSDNVSLKIDRIELINWNPVNDSIFNNYLMMSLDSSTLHDAVLKVNWPESSIWSATNQTFLWAPPPSAFSFSDVHASCGAAGAMINGNNGWCTSDGGTGSSKYMIIDAGATVRIFGVATQGRATGGQWVTQYTISTSNDLSNWTVHGTFPGNTDMNTIVNTTISPSVNARYVRISPEQRNGYSSMRAGLFMCCVPLPGPMVDSATNIMTFRGMSAADAGPATWNIHTSGFAITAAVLLKSITGDQTLIHLFNSPATVAFNIILEFIASGGSGFDIRFLIYNEENEELNSGCSTSSNDQPLRALNTIYVVTVTYDTVAKIGKIYVDGLLRKQCPVGSNAAHGPRTLQFSYLGQSAHYSKRFIGNLYRLAVYDRSLSVEEIIYQHQTLKSNVAVATIAMVGSTLYEFQLNYSSVNFSRVGLMVSIFVIE
jgi:hypothetical protein